MTDRTFLNETICQAYNIAIEDIRFFKRQQWHITYYTLLLYAAIIYAGKLSADNLLICVILIGALILSLCSSLYLIHVFRGIFREC